MSNKFDEFGIAENFSKWCFDLEYKDIPNEVIHMIGKDQIVDLKRIMYRFILCDYFSIALYAIHYITIRLWLIRLPLHRADPSSA